MAQAERGVNLTEENVLEALLLAIRVTYEPYLRSFQFKVLHYILYMNDLLYKIKHVALFASRQQKLCPIFF